MSKEMPDIQHLRHPRYDSTEDSRLKYSPQAKHWFSICRYDSLLFPSIDIDAPDIDEGVNLFWRVRL
jgi:hypothetical protein